MHEVVRTHGLIVLLHHGFQWLVLLPIRDTQMVMAHQTQRMYIHGNLITSNLKIGHDMSQVGLQHQSATVDLVQLMWCGLTATRNKDDCTMQTNCCGCIDFLNESLGPNLHHSFLNFPGATSKSFCKLKLLFLMLKHKVMGTTCPFQ